MSPSKQKHIAVIIPVYNPPHYWEESSLEHILALNTLYPRYIFTYIIVNDGSENHIFRRLRKLLQKATVQYNFYNLEKNFGKGKALRTGVSKIKTDVDYIICVDWDFPFGVSVIGEMIELLARGFDVVLADRGNEYLHKLPIFRSLVTKSWRTFMMNILKLKNTDTQGGLKGLSNKAKKVFMECETDSFLHDFEFVLQSEKAQLKMTSVKAYVRGGVKLYNFPLKTYVREGQMLSKIIQRYYFPEHKKRK